MMLVIEMDAVDTTSALLLGHCKELVSYVVSEKLHDALQQRPYVPQTLLFGGRRGFNCSLDVHSVVCSLAVVLSVKNECRKLNIHFLDFIDGNL